MKFWWTIHARTCVTRSRTPYLQLFTYKRHSMQNFRYIFYLLLYQIPGSNSSSVITIKREAKCRYHTVVIVQCHRLKRSCGKNESPTFLWYDTDRIENNESNNSSIVMCVFVAAVTFLPSRCLTMIRGYTYRHTDWWKGFMRCAIEMGSVAMIYTYQVS
jgi:hypothetical protein